MPTNIEYFSKIGNADTILIDLNAKYTKQSFANRCYVNGPHKIECLNVPVVKGAKSQQLNEVKISYAEKWQLRNWRTIENCYRKTPFFEFYESYFRTILLETSYDKLYLLNNKVLSLCLKLLQKNTYEYIISSYEPGVTILAGSLLKKNSKWIVDLGDPVLTPYIKKHFKL